MLVQIVTVLNTELVEPGTAAGFHRNRFGQVDFEITPTSNYEGNLTVIGRIPDGYIPTRRKLFIGKFTDNESGDVRPATFYFNSNGDISVYTATQAKTNLLFALGGSYSIK